MGIKRGANAMTLYRRDFVAASCAAVATAAFPYKGWTQSYPSQPVRVIVPFAAGGPTDLLARIVAEGLSGQLGKQFFVENVGGAGGNIGTGRAALAEPDGHTILVAAPSFAINPTLYESVPYDWQKSFDAVTIAATSQTVLTVHPTVPAHTVNELVDAINARPAQFSYASPGAGTPPHLIGELFRLSLKLELVHVPFKSGGAALQSTLGGHTPISFGAVPPAVQHVNDGKLRALAVTSNSASPALPTVPVMAQAGYPDIVGDIWTAILVPAGTPTEVRRLLQRETSKLMLHPDVKKRMAGLGYQGLANSPDECAAYISSEARKWTKVIRDAGIKLQ
jgi:tripartite-type tricarboxylate transporter receptor subunit TctC